MLKQQLFNKGITLTKELSDMAAADIKFNIGFNKKDKSIRFNDSS